MGRDAVFSWDVLCLCTHVVCSAALLCSALLSSEDPGRSRNSCMTVTGLAQQLLLRLYRKISLRMNHLTGHAQSPPNSEQGGKVLITAAKGRSVDSSVAPRRTEKGACCENCTSITYHKIQVTFGFCLQVEASWANLRALVAVETAGLLFGERLFSFLEGILTQFLKQQ